MATPNSNLPTPAVNGQGSPFDRIMLLDHNGQERWSARDLGQIAGYEQWRQVDEVVQRAMEAVAASGMDAHDHFASARKVITGGRWGKQEVTDYRLTRFGAYHFALAADGRKPEVALAKTYFAVKTREAELAQEAEPDVTSPEGILVLAEKYVAAARDLVKTKKELAIAKPKAGKWDAFCNADGLIDMAAAAKVFSSVTGGLGRTKFMDLLRTEDIHFLQVQNPRIPYECHVQAGRAKVKLVPAGPGVVEQTFFTTKGLDWIADRLGYGQEMDVA